MSVQTIFHEDICIAQTKGNINFQLAEELNSLTTAAIDEGFAKVIFDFSYTKHISSDGLFSVLEIIKKLTSYNGKAAISAPNNSTRNILELSGISKLINVYSTLDEAISNLKL